MIPLIATADDYGIAPATNTTIRLLIEEGHLSGTSCMTVFPEWSDAGAAIRSAPAMLGVHLTLTDQPRLTGGTSGSFGALARSAWLGRLDTSAVEAELHAQVDAFEEAIGRPPDFLDGHQHVHQLPQIRDIVLRLASRLAPDGWVRTCHESWSAIRARPHRVRSTLFRSAGTALHHACRARNIPTNHGFTGIYDFVGPFDARPYLQRVTPRTAFMVHPGSVDETLRRRDGLTDQREAEASYLFSDAWPSLLDELGLVLVRKDPALHDHEVEEEAAAVGEGLGEPG